MIAKSFEEAFPLVQELVNDFRQSEAYFLSSKYSEPRVREDFINKFWMALGWDVAHREQKNPHEQEVTVEKNVNVEGRGKRADYAFSVAPNFRDVRFFVEAKKPSKNIDNADDYFQTVRYGWNAQTQIAVLMDFGQFRILDCRYEPDIDSVLSYGALEKYHYADYADEEKFRRIYHLFSRADVGNGALEKYAAGLKKPSARTGQRALFVTGRFQSVDESFLKNLDTYREKLAHTFKSSNPQLESPELTEVTQRTLDRLVFMRFLEDKLIETDELVQKIVDSQRPWRDFVATSRKLNGTYNGIIFREHELLDAPDFKIDERTFTDICESLSHARSPYLFNYIPIHILGSIYERFLGKTIVVEGAGASVQDKPEVRKAGGVYYTPEYIVRYIVENTVGRLIEGKTPEEVSRMRFADISCGSGSFLLGVYDLLLRYHRTYYNASKKRKAEGRKAGGVELPDGTLQLSLKQKRAILTKNVYGVDVDAQAVEVAQLSLYLKLLEDETTASARLYQIELGDKLLPSLSKNIISGNSLIDWDILSGKLFDKHEERKLNPMSFKEEFPQIMKDGGFDAIVGNPPYGAQFSELEKSYIRSNYESYKYKYDSYIYFVERALKLVKKGGYVSFITPELWLKLENCAPLRRLILENAGFEKLNICGENVFSQAVVNTVVFVLHVGVAAGYIQIESGSDTWKLPITAWSSAEGLTINYRLRPKTASIVNKIKSGCELLSNYGEAIQGITAYDKYRGQDPDLIKRRGYHYPYKHDESCGKWLAGMDVSRYELKWSGEWLSYGSWLGAPRDPRFFNGQRLLFREIPGENKRIQATMATETYYHGHSITPFKLNTPKGVNIRYILAIVNSKLISWYGKLTLSNFGKDIFPKLNPQDVKALPIHSINFSKPAEKAQHDKVVQLVEQMLDAKKQLTEAVTDRDKNLYERKCANLDRQIDGIVYELYGLTKEEIELVEAG